MRRSIAATALLSFLLVGCMQTPMPEQPPAQPVTANAEPQQPPPAFEPAPAPAPLPDPAPAPQPDPAPAPSPQLPASAQNFSPSWIFECANDYGVEQVFYAPHEVWASGLDLKCAAIASEDIELTDLDEEALITAYTESYNPDSLKYLVGQCASTTNGYILKALGVSEGHLSESQVLEAKGALVLCPDHPVAEEMNQLIGTSIIQNAIEAEWRKNNITHDRTYKVGEDIYTGTWQTVDTQVTDCRWEFQDMAGNIMESQEIASGPQITLTIPDIVYRFATYGCGDWTRIADL